MARIIECNEFQTEVLQSEIPVLVDFFATWCGPCKMIAPTLDEISVEYEGRAKVIKVDTDQCKELAASYGVRSIPTLIFFKGGEKVDTLLGALPKGEITSHIDKLLQ